MTKPELQVENTTNVWQEYGSTFSPGTTSTNRKLLPAGIFQYNQPPMGPWFLSKVSEKFLFPYKIYGSFSHIINRIQRAWGQIDANLGVLLNGIKGTGKTVTGQLVANWAVEQGMPVLVVSHPVPLGAILERIEQPCMVIFDEFEKTHREEDDQHALLTALDGMARNNHKRLFVFTTNTKRVDTNFMDRPSRIRYIFEFGRLEDNVIEELMQDLLRADLKRFKPEISTYLSTRHVLSIDVVKTVLQEVNIFAEDPEQFAKIMNLSEQEVHGFVVEILDKNGKLVKNLANYFSPSSNIATLLRRFLTKSGEAEFIESYLNRKQTFLVQDPYTHLGFQLIAPTEKPGIWICNLQMPVMDTWLSKYPKLRSQYLYQDCLWLDEKPEGWEVPRWAARFEAGEELTDEEQEGLDEWDGQDTVYGGDKHAKLQLRITPNFSTQTNWKSSDYDVAF